MRSLGYACRFLSSIFFIIDYYIIVKTSSYSKGGFDSVYHVFRSIILNKRSQRIVYSTLQKYRSSLLGENDSIVNVSKSLDDFIFENFDFELDPLYKDFSEHYGINALLTCLVATSRSQMGKNFWERIKIKTPFLTDNNIRKIRSKLIQSGQYLITLQALIFNILDIFGN